MSAQKLIFVYTILSLHLQMLVYENYSKFISATDTIRKMKNNVNDMKSEMDSLVKNMEGIASRMTVVNNFLAGKRAKVRKGMMWEKR